MKTLATAATAAAALAGSLIAPAGDVDAQLANPATPGKHANKKKRHRARCASADCVQRVAAKRCSQTRVSSCLHRAALRWHVSFPVLKRKAACESGGNPYAINGRPENRQPDPSVWETDTSSGLMQFKPSTWLTTPYAKRSIWSAKYNALAGAWMHRVGRGGEWVCR
jgi:hypothetical protein